MNPKHAIQRYDIAALAVFFEAEHKRPPISASNADKQSLLSSQSRRLVLTGVSEVCNTLFDPYAIEAVCGGFMFQTHT